MGCDGGTIPRRDELVRTKKKPEQKDKNAETVAKWKHCAISQEPLRKPIVACELGRLYNKEAVLEQILSKDKAASNASHITKLADVKELNLTEKTGFEQKDQKGDEYVDFNNSRYICPVTGLDMNGRQRFYLMWKCGCVLSERAVKEVKSETCHKCGLAYTENDVIILNGSDEEILDLTDKMTERRRLAKLEKKKKRAATVTTEATSEKKVKLDAEQPSTSTSGAKANTNGIEKASTSGGTAKAAANGQSSKTNSNGTDKATTSKGTAKNVILPEKATNNYSIAKDPNASAAYKSLFTTHKSAQQKEKAHWITHNPLFY